VRRRQPLTINSDTELRTISTEPTQPAGAHCIRRRKALLRRLSSSIAGPRSFKLGLEARLSATVLLYATEPQTVSNQPSNPGVTTESF